MTTRLLQATLLGLIGGFLFTGCAKKSPNYSDLPAFVGDTLTAVIEIPAGTNHKIEYNYSSNTFEVEQVEGTDRIVRFLPYPGNYGFIPGTFMDPLDGGDGDALDVLVLSENVPTGTIIHIVPIGMLLMVDDGEKDYKVIAVPVDVSQSPLKATQLDDLTYEMRTIIELWFKNYKRNSQVEITGWQSEAAALEEIKKWQAGK